MEEYIKKKIWSMGKTVVSYITVHVLLFYLISLLNEKLPAIILMFLIPYIVFGIPITCYVYAKKIICFSKSINRLKKNGKMDVLDDIDFENPISSGMKIYAGADAFFSKREMLILPYSEIAWVYMHKESINGFCINNCVIFRAKDGGKYSISNKNGEMLELLRYIVKGSPDVMIGYTTEQKRKYDVTYLAPLRKKQLIKFVKIVALIVVACFVGYLVVQMFVDDNKEGKKETKKQAVATETPTFVSTATGTLRPTATHTATLKPTATHTATPKPTAIYTPTPEPLTSNRLFGLVESGRYVNEGMGISFDIDDEYNINFPTKKEIEEGTWVKVFDGTMSMEGDTVFVNIQYAHLSASEQQYYLPMTAEQLTKELLYARCSQIVEDEENGINNINYERIEVTFLGKKTWGVQENADYKGTDICSLELIYVVEREYLVIINFLSGDSQVVCDACGLVEPFCK